MTRGARLATALAVLALAAAFASGGLPARAVDRSLGARLPKPSVGGTPWTDADRTRLAADLDGLLGDAPALRGAHVGLLVLDTRSGDVLYARNADDAFVPASTMKLLTGSAALALLGPAYRFHTEADLAPDGTDLILRVGGDPLLANADLMAMGRAVHAIGVVELERGVHVDASAFVATPYPRGWSWDDFPYDYAAALSAAAVEENVVHLTVMPGPAVGTPVRVTVSPVGAVAGLPMGGCSPTQAVVVIVSATTASRGTASSLDLARDSGGCIVLTGTLALDGPQTAIDAAVPSPVWYVRALAREALTFAGVRSAQFADVVGPNGAGDDAETTPSGARVVWMHDGEPLSDLLADMWWPSDNFIAEALLQALGANARGAPGSTNGGIDAERAWLRGIGVDPATLTLADGSGLSTYDRLTPRALAAILQYDWFGANREVVLDDLPLAGERGTLRRKFAGSPAEGRTFAKTGSVSHARGLAGYLATLHHGAVTFAWSVDDWMETDDALDALRGRLLSRIVDD